MPRRASLAAGDSASGAKAEAPRLRGFPPVIDRRVEVLILGSFPSEASLAAGEYYAHPRNQFWRLLGAVLGEPLAELPYPQRLRRVLAHRVGIWDVIDACDRAGSLDASIRNERANELARLTLLAPKLRRLAFNGGAAGRYARRFSDGGYETVVLPSSSPAHASRSFAQKLRIWQKQLTGASPRRGLPRRTA
jgi:hypoxanthine-DNA glycosylase